MGAAGFGKEDAAKRAQATGEITVAVLGALAQQVLALGSGAPDSGEAVAVR